MESSAFETATLTLDGPILSQDGTATLMETNSGSAGALTQLDVSAGDEDERAMDAAYSPTNESCGGGSGAEDNGEKAATVAPADADAMEALGAESDSGKSSPTGVNMKSKIPKLGETGIAPPKRRSLPSPGGSTLANGRLGMAARVAPQATLERRIRRSTSSSEVAARLKLGGSTSAAAASTSAVATSAAGDSDAGKAKKMSTVESRRAYALAMRARIAAAAEAKKALQPVSASAATPTKKPMPKRKSTPSPSVEPLSVRRSSFSSQSSCSSIGSSIASSTTSALSAANSTSTNGTATSRLNRIKSAGSVPSFSNVSDRYSTISSSPYRTASSSGGSSGFTGNPMLKKLWPSAGAINADEFSLESTSVEDLKSQHIIAEKGVQELLKFSTTSVNVKARQEEAKLLKGGIVQLSQHSATLMTACEALEQRSQRQDQELQISRLEIQRLLNLLAEEKEPMVFSDDAAEEDAALSSQTDSEPNEEPGDGTEPAKPRVPKMDSPLTNYVNEMMKKATDQIEEKWKARFAEQLAEHEQALAQERARSSASVMSNSRLVTETKHEKEDEMKELREKNVRIAMEKKQLEFETDAVRRELDFIKSLLNEKDEERSSSTFWQKTTDLAKANRVLTEDVTQLNQMVNKLNEAARIAKIKMKELKVENFERVGKTKVLEVEKQVLQDKLAAMEAKFEDEKTRREQFQVNVEQLTVENTALYAQMVALQTTHEAKMEELRSRYEKRNFVLAGEMRLLQTQNKLMRNSEFVHANGGGSSVAYDEDEGELSDRLKEMTEELLNVRQELSEKVDQIAELEWRIGESEQVRRKLHNTIQELRGNIRVHVRLRPFLRSDGLEASSENPKPSIRADAFSSTIVTNTEKPHSFAFDKIYEQSDSQEHVFNDVSDFIQSAMDGYNVCIFAYGQTGSGKTHTMQGSGKAQMRGIIPRSIQLIIKCCKELSAQGWQYSLDVTFFEIYNETIRDLLATDSTDERKFNIRTDKRGKNYVEGLRMQSIDFAYAEEQVEDIVNLAACNRSVDKTDMNAHSSRSHSIFALTIRGFNEAQNTEVEGTLSLVDLAGSERLSRSNATGHRLKEAQAINKSLSSLADVFQALAKKSAHVPYRNSKLTYVLQPALSGDGKTLMMVNLSPTYASLDESLCSLRFAQNVSQCELGAPTRQIKSRVGTSSSNVGGPATPSSTTSSTTSSSAPASAPGALRSPARIPISTRSRASLSATTPIAKKLFP
uniref:Kinesin motor domain-containing protein n=1 Tax=Globisporangium ultimum (strain ATCC 200006 / CBS 805.95 / DAOM BR144) TaxID=431595 RepID=K3WUK1_GLOUD